MSSDYTREQFVVDKDYIGSKLLQTYARKLKPIEKLGRFFGNYNTRYFVLNMNTLDFFYAKQNYYKLKDVKQLYLQEFIDIKNEPHIPISNKTFGESYTFGITFYKKNRYITLLFEDYNIYEKWVLALHSIKIAFNQKPILRITYSIPNTKIEQLMIQDKLRMSEMKLNGDKITNLDNPSSATNVNQQPKQLNTSQCSPTSLSKQLVQLQQQTQDDKQQFSQQRFQQKQKQQYQSDKSEKFSSKKSAESSPKSKKEELFQTDTKKEKFDQIIEDKPKQNQPNKKNSYNSNGEENAKDKSEKKTKLKQSEEKSPNKINQKSDDNNIVIENLAVNQDMNSPQKNSSFKNQLDININQPQTIKPKQLNDLRDTFSEQKEQNKFVQKNMDQNSDKSDKLLKFQEKSNCKLHKNRLESSLPQQLTNSNSGDLNTEMLNEISTEKYDSVNEHPDQIKVIRLGRQNQNQKGISNKKKVVSQNNKQDLNNLWGDGSDSKGNNVEQSKIQKKNPRQQQNQDDEQLVCFSNTEIKFSQPSEKEIKEQEEDEKNILNNILQKTVQELHKDKNQPLNKESQSNGKQQELQQVDIQQKQNQTKKKQNKTSHNNKYNWNDDDEDDNIKNTDFLQTSSSNMNGFDKDKDKKNNILQTEQPNIKPENNQTQLQTFQINQNKVQKPVPQNNYDDWDDA